MTQGSTEMTWQAVRDPHDGDAIVERSDTQANLVRLVSAVEAHEIAELDAVAVYRELARAARDPVIGSLLRVLLDDEEHHHRVLNGIGMSLRGLASGTRERRMLPCDEPTSASLELLRRFARQEREGGDELRSLAREAPELFDGLFALLLNLMAIDSAKHELILRFVVRELEAAGGA
jgi:hypothetical protein